MFMYLGMGWRYDVTTLYSQDSSSMDDCERPNDTGRQDLERAMNILSQTPLVNTLHLYLSSFYSSYG